MVRNNNVIHQTVIYRDRVKSLKFFFKIIIFEKTVKNQFLKCPSSTPLTDLQHNKVNHLIILSVWNPSLNTLYSLNENSKRYTPCKTLKSYFYAPEVLK